jgi:hypothetical protein
MQKGSPPPHFFRSVRSAKVHTGVTEVMAGFVCVGLGYKAMMMIEAGLRRMKTTGVRIRPVSHWTAHRMTRHMKLGVRALLLERAAEIRVGDTWRTLRFALEEVQAGRSRVHGITLVQSTRLTTQVTASLKKLGVKPPPRVLSIESSSATPCNP